MTDRINQCLILFISNFTLILWRLSAKAQQVSRRDGYARLFIFHNCAFVSACHNIKVARTSPPQKADKMLDLRIVHLGEFASSRDDKAVWPCLYKVMYMIDQTPQESFFASRHPLRFNAAIVAEVKTWLRQQLASKAQQFYVISLSLKAD